jgi:hypothetical protein
MTSREKATTAAMITVLVALLLVGMVSGTIIRHTVQVVPVLLATVVIMAQPGWSRFAVMPVFAFWLFIMLLIWSYLLGLANVITGQFTPAEVGLTVVIGLACVAGLAASASATRRSPVWAGVAAFVIFGALQVGAMWLSLQPAFAVR